MIKLLQHTEINTEQWNQLLETSPHASFFQTKACYDFYCSLTFMKGFVYAVEEDNQLVGLMCGYIIADGGKIKRFFSRRAIVPGGLLLYENISDKALSSLLEFSQKQLAKRAIYIEIRNYTDYSRWKAIFDNNGFSYQPHLNFHVDCSDKERAFSNLKSNKRRYIRLSIKEGAEWYVASKEEDVIAFYEILKDLYQHKIKLPLFPLSFFLALFKLENGKIILVRYKDQIVGGAAFVILNKKKIYEWFVCGEDRVYKNVYPSILTTWGGIEYANEQDIAVFDFMGAGKPDVAYGVRNFKAEFGGELVEHGRFLSVLNSFLFSLGKFAINIIKRR